MSVLIALQQFVGANTQRNPKEPLGPGIGVDARNLDPSHADFRGLKAANVVHTLTGLATQQISAYRFGRDTESDTQYWLTSSRDVNWVRSLIALDTTERTYWTDGVKPRYTDNTMLGTPPYPTGSVTLGVPAPAAAMVATNTTPGTGPDETRLYLDTFLRPNGDESAPNPNVTSITVPGGTVVTLNSFAPVPGGSHGITKRRIYCSTSGSEFLRVAEITTGTASYADDGSSRGAVLGTGGSSSRPTWLEPPDTLVGLIELWSGMIGGHLGKSLRICVPDFPHAWPIEYEYIVPHTIVGTAKFGNTWVAVTTGNPYLLTGSRPGSMQQQPVMFDQAGVGKRSVVSVKHGVCYASKDGLCYIGTNGPPRVLTAPFIDTATWQSLVPSSIIGAHWRGWYLGFYFDGVNRRGFMVNTLDPQGVIWLDQGAYGVFEDSISGSVYLLDSSYRIRKWYTGSLLTASFKTAKTRASHETNPSRALVVGTDYTGASLKVYADDTLRHTQSLSSREPFWLPGGYVGRDFQLELSGTGPIEAALLAEETVDLP